MKTQTSGHGPKKSWGRRLSRAGLVLFSCLAVLVLLAFAAVNLPWVRARVAREVGRVASEAIAGTVEVTRIGRIGIGSVSGVDVHLLDPSGRKVIALSDTSAQLDVSVLLASLVGDAPLTLAFERVALSEVDLWLREGPDGELSFIAALEPESPEAEKRDFQESAGQPPRWRFERITLEHGAVRGEQGALADLDVELRDLIASGSVDAESVRFDLRSGNVAVVGLPAVDELEGDLSGAVALRLDAAEGGPLPIDARAHWSGSAAGLPLQASARYVDEQLSGYVDIEAAPSSLRRLWPSAATEDSVSLLIGFEGPLEGVTVLAMLESSGGSLYVNGHVTLSPDVSGRLSVLALRLEPGRWLSDVPESSLELAAAASFSVEEGGLEGHLALCTWSATWAGRSVPDLAVSARLMDDEARATLRFALPGGRAVARVAVSPLDTTDDEPRQLDLGIDATVHDFTRLAAALGLGEGLGGNARLEGHAKIDLQGVPSIVGSRFSATARDVTAGSVGVRSAVLEVSPAGSLLNPRLTFRLNARGLSLPGYSLRSVRLQGRGNLKELALRGGLEPEKAAPARLRARLFPSEKLARDVELVMDEGGPAKPLRFSAQRLAFGASGVEVRNLQIEGPIAGRLHVDGSVHGGRVRAQGSAIDFAPFVLARRLGIELDVPRGVADLDFAVDYRPGHISGTLAGRVTRVCVGELKGGRLEVDLAAEDNVVDGSATVHAPDLFQARLSADSLALPASLQPAQLSRMTGELAVIADADVGQLQTLLDPRWLSPSNRGQVRARLLLTAAPGATHPKLVVAISTRDLSWSMPIGASDPDSARETAGPQSATWRGMDWDVVAEVESSRVKVFAALLDSQRSSIAAARGTMEVSVARLLQAPQEIDVRDLPIDISVQVPTRDLDAFPVLPLRFDELDGSLSAHLTARGTLGRPEIAGQLKLTELKLQDRPALPLAITADAKLEGERLELSAAVKNQDRRLLSLRAEARVSGGGALPAIDQLDLDLRSNGLPLESLGAALDMNVAGELFGSLRVQDLSKRPTAQGTLWINDPMFGGFRQHQIRWVIDASPEAFSTQLELRQPEGRARATASGPWKWGGQLVPRLEPRRVSFRVQANNFDLQALRALLPEQARALRGRLDAAVTVARGEEREISGNVQVREGGIYVGALGQEFHDIQLDATVEPSGAVSIERLSARALSGRLSARGSAELDGFSFRNAHLTGEIPRDDPLPFMFEGVTVAEASGRFNVDARLEPGTEAGRRRLDIDVTVPRFNVSLPEQTPHAVQQIEDDPTITTGTYVEPNRFLTLPIPPYEPEEDATTSDAAAPLAVNIEIQLGDEVWVERGTQLEVKLLGSMVLELKEELSARGELRIARGTIDVRGRIFEIERGVITFVEERAPSNPTVVATARYTAPEGTEVYAEFVGPVETGTLSLRSEPPLRDDQILSLLLFGTPDGNFGASTSQGDGSLVGGAAFAAGGSVVTRGLNQELRRFTALDIQTRIGENEGQPQPEVVVQISPRVTAELAYSMGVANPARARDRTYLTLDLRLFRNWSLSSTIGDAGSLLLELLWRYRY